jgi:hypothetical protein
VTGASGAVVDLEAIFPRPAADDEVDDEPDEAYDGAYDDADDEPDEAGEPDEVAEQGQSGAVEADEPDGEAADRS